MNKDKVEQLKVYLAKIKESMNAPIPDKHKSREKEYKAYLANESRMTQLAIDRLLLDTNK